MLTNEKCLTSKRLAWVTIFIGSVMAVGCQKNITEFYPSGKDSGKGIIVGSVTAPFADHYHEVVYFYFQSVGGEKKFKGMITSATSYKNPLISGPPACDEDGLDQECGRLFAIKLPTGKYQIYNIRVGNNYFKEIVPSTFVVTEGEVTYVGDLHVDFCVGLPHSLRGAILGADVSIIDNFERDEILLKRKFTLLSSLPINTELLQDYSWSWRVPFTPYDWGTCGFAREIKR